MKKKDSDSYAMNASDEAWNNYNYRLWNVTADGDGNYKYPWIEHINTKQMWLNKLVKEASYLSDELKFNADSMDFTE